MIDELPVAACVENEQVTLLADRSAWQQATEMALKDPAYRAFGYESQDVDIDRLIEGRHQAVNERRANFWAVAEKPSGDIVGLTELKLDAKHGWIEGAYWTVDSCRRRGLASAAVRAMTTWAEGDAEIGEIVLVIGPNNHGSRRVAEKAGYTYRGLLMIHELSVDPVEIYFWCRAGAGRADEAL